MEAFAELSIQQSQWGRLVMLDAAEYLGFDCYGDFNNCGGGIYTGAPTTPQPMATYIEWISQTIHQLETNFDATGYGCASDLTTNTFPTKVDQIQTRLLRPIHCLAIRRC